MTTELAARSSSTASTRSASTSRAPSPSRSRRVRATQQAAAILTGSRVVGAFHNVSASLLEDTEVDRIETDVLVLGDDRDATDLVQSIADMVPGMRGLYGGRLRNAHQVEALTANLIAINRRYKVHAGIRVTDV